MRRSSLFILASVLSALPAAYAQDSIVGKYTGMMERAGMGGAGVTHHDTVYLVIDKVEAGIVEGTATLAARGCGDVAVHGVLGGSKLTLRRSAKGEAKQGCGVNWELTVAGNKLEGKTSSGNTLRFSK